MEERRQFVRLDTRLEVSYALLPAGRQQRTATRNIGTGGICLFLDQVATPGAQLQVAMTIPGRDAPVNFIAEVVWCEEYEVISRTERRRSVEAGVRFLDIAPQDQQAVMEHIILSLQPPP